MDAQSPPPVSLLSSSESLLSTDSPSVRPLSLPSEPSSGAISHISKIARCKNVCAQGESYRRTITIGTLPDNVLLEIFDSYRDGRRPVWEWHLLAHVCHRWRQVVFASPHRLNLQILCTHKTPARKLGIWPALPIIIVYHHSGSGSAPNAEDNLIAALEHRDRVSRVRFDVTGSQLGKMVTVMQEPFPVLTRLDIFSADGNAPVLPAEFLGGSAPRLQDIYLQGIPSPALPTLLLSTSDLVTLNLSDIPPTGYISPKAMVVSLAALPNLESLIIEFRSATRRPDRTHPPPVTRTVLPTLTFFQFKGASEYLEDLVSRIDGPRLNEILIDYLNQLVDFQVAQLSKFINRSVGSESTPLKHAQVSFFSGWVDLTMRRHASVPLPLRTIVSCQGIDWQVSHMTQVLSEFSAVLSKVVHLRLKAEGMGDVGRPQLLHQFPTVQMLHVSQEPEPEPEPEEEGMDDVEWLQFLRQFSTVRTLHVSQELAGRVALVLEDITEEMVAEVFPSLDLIYLKGQPASAVEKFVAARRLSDFPVTVIDAETEFDEGLKSYVGK